MANRIECWIGRWDGTVDELDGWVRYRDMDGWVEVR